MKVYGPYLTPLAPLPAQKNSNGYKNAQVLSKKENIKKTTFKMK